MQRPETRKYAVAFASLGAACTVMDEIGSGGQGKVAFGRACPSVTQKRPLVSHFPTARWVALGHENESTGCRSPANGIGNRERVLAPAG
jgi:hypothetical protein